MRLKTRPFNREPNQKSFTEMIKTTNSELKQYFSGIDEKSKILWYPSSGYDFRDCFYFKKEVLEKYGLNIEEPDYFIHTDYDKTVLDNDLIHEDRASKITVENRTEFDLDDANYFINDNYITFQDCKNVEPKGVLLDLKFESNNVETFNKKVIFLFYENINFFETFVLLNGMKISHIYKFREGCGFGGGNQSISFVYLFLGYMKTKYLLVDSEVHYDNTSFLRSSRVGRRDGFERGYLARSESYYDYFNKEENYLVSVEKIHTIDKWNDMKLYYYLARKEINDNNKEEKSLNNLKYISERGNKNVDESEG